MLFSNKNLRNGLFLDLLFALPQPIPYVYYQWTWQCGLKGHILVLSLIISLLCLYLAALICDISLLVGQTCKYEIDVLIILTMAMCRLVLLWRFVFAHSRFWEKQVRAIDHAYESRSSVSDLMLTLILAIIFIGDVPREF